METLRRALAMLVRPGRTWDVAADEPVDARALLVRYVAPLAAIPAVFGFVGPLIFAFGIASVRVRANPLSLALEMAAGYLLMLAGVVLLGLWIALIGPAFGAGRDRGRALQLVGYSGTAAWVAGVFALYPSLDLSVRILAWVWSLWTLYLGLTPMTGVPEERRLTFFGAILLSGLVLAVAVGVISGWAAALGGPLRVV